MENKILFALGLSLILSSHLLYAQDAPREVTRAINGKSLLLASGDTVRLAGIEAPNAQEENTQGHPGRPGEPLGEEAKAALQSMTAGKAVRIDAIGTGRDRHNRLLGQVYLSDGLWLQGEMLRRGWAMVYSFRDDPPAIIAKMLALEREAQGAGRGIWAHPYFRVIAPQEADAFVNRFKLVQGKVISVNHSHGNIYLNFSQEWRGHFAVFIPRTYAGDFAALKLDSLPGKTVRVRGWIHYHNAPMIDITHTQELEVQ